MLIGDVTLALFTTLNAIRSAGYVPQLFKAARCRQGACAVSVSTWTLFAISHCATVAYALVNQQDRVMAAVFLLNAIGCFAIAGVAAWKQRCHAKEGTATKVVSEATATAT